MISLLLTIAMTLIGLVALSSACILAVKRQAPSGVLTARLLSARRVLLIALLAILVASFVTEPDWLLNLVIRE